MCTCIKSCEVLPVSSHGSAQALISHTGKGKAANYAQALNSTHWWHAGKAAGYAQALKLTHWYAGKAASSGDGVDEAE